ncbi:LPD1 domain-containing protein (plasmid) [Acinetobacter baumannii]
MSDVDYKTCKTVIDNNPLLKSVYELQLKLNGKMQRDEIFSENGKELIVNRIDELVDSNLKRVRILTDAISMSLDKQGLSRVASLLEGWTTSHINNVKKLQEFDITNNIKNYLIDNDLHIKRDQMYRAVKTIYKELQDNNAPVGKYTIANPITREFNTLARSSQSSDEIVNSEKEILKHLRSHKIIKEIEKLLHESVFYLVQRQTLPLFIDQVNSIGGSKISILKGVALDHYQSYMEKSFQTGKGLANKLDLDLVFNNNNFASQSKILDKDRKQYFSLVAERFTQCGEALVTDLLAEKGVQVDYLVACMEDPQTNEQRAGITPSGNDRTEILKAFKSVIEACRSYAFNLEKDIKDENEVNQKMSNTLSFGVG